MLQTLAGEQALLEPDECNRHVRLDCDTQRATAIRVQPRGNIQCQHPPLETVDAANDLRVKTGDLPVQSRAEQAVDDDFRALEIRGHEIQNRAAGRLVILTCQQGIAAQAGNRGEGINADIHSRL
jgi:hypothetical protein